MVTVISRTSKYTTLKIANKIADSFFVSKRQDIEPKEMKTYIPSNTDKKEIEKAKLEFKNGKYSTLKEFLLDM